MTFNEAFRVGAETGNREFLDFISVVTKAFHEGKASPCLIFSVDGECFSWGYDGVKFHKCKHTKKRSAYLLAHGTLVIR